ncbi:glycerol-3-phosphate ABC transporter [Klebsiella pneumoniae]|nr:glycerol-3-phosphate ABC transporter [Klebsiella pneumoniae]
MNRSSYRRWPGINTDSKTGHLLSQPFNSSTPVLYYNKDAFKKAGLDPEQPPKTWQDLAAYTAKLKAAGMKCGYASGWQGWIQIENFSAWHGLPVATKNNGFDGTDAVLEFNKPEQVKHIALLEEMNKKGDFSYFGRKDESTEKFYNGDCAITTASSGSLADIRQYAKFNYGVGMMPLRCRRERRAAERHHRRGQPVGDAGQRPKRPTPAWRSSSTS